MPWVACLPDRNVSEALNYDGLGRPFNFGCRTNGALAERLRQTLFAGKAVVQPDPAMVQAYHGPGGYLERLEAAFERLRANPSS
jgi:hypothetical protein